MSFRIKHASFMLNLAPLCHYGPEEGRRTIKISKKPEFMLSASKRRDRTLLKMSATKCRPAGFFENHVEGSPAAGEPMDEADPEQKELQDEVQKFRDATGGGGEGDNNGNGNGGRSGGGGGRDDEDDGLESNHDNATGIEWWWWWKWQQARLRSQEATSGSHLWPVDAALQVVANEVKETIEPAVRAIVMEPLREHTKHGLILFLVVGAFVVACMEMVAGLAVVSMGLSLGFLATLGSAFLWWSWKHRASSPSPPPHNGSGNKNENGKGRGKFYLTHACT